jgi:hypothetical protein
VRLAAHDERALAALGIGPGGEPGFHHLAGEQIQLRPMGIQFREDAVARQADGAPDQPRR